MNRKYLLTFMAAMGLLLFNHVLAQDLSSLKNATPVQRAQFQTNMMKSKLKLDPEQAARAQSINLKYAEKMQPILKNNDSRIARARQAMTLQAQKDNELKTVFSKDQFKQYKGFETALRNKMMKAVQGE